MVGLVFKVLSIRYRYLFFFCFRLADFGSLFYRIGSTFNDLIGCRLVILFLFFLRTMKRSEPFIVARKRRRGTNRRAGASIHGFFFFGFSFVFCWIFIFPFFVFVITPTKKKNGNHETIVPFFSPDDKTFCVFFCFLFCALLFFVWNDLIWWSYFFKRHQSTTVFYRVTTEMRPWLFWHAPLRLFYFIFFWGRMFSIVPLNLSLNRQLHKDIGLEYQSFKEKEVLGLAVPTWRSDFARKEIRSIPKVFLFVFFLETELEYRSLSILIALQQ